MTCRIVLSLALAALAASSPVTSHALTIAGYGIRGGSALSRMHGPYGDLVASQRRAGFAGAWYLRVGDGALSLQPEIAWAGKGGKDRIEFAITGTPTNEVWAMDVGVRIDYLELPLLVRLDAPSRWGVRPFLVAGPSVAFKVGSQIELDDPPLSSRTSPRSVRYANIFEEVGTLDGPRYRPIDVGLMGGAGLTVGGGPVRAVLDARYEYGARSVLSSIDGHNGAWLVTAGIDLR